MHPWDCFLGRLCKFLHFPFRDIGPSCSARRHSQSLGVEQLETRTVLSPVVQLPAGGGSYQIAFESGDAVIRQSGGPELYRSPISNSAGLTIKGTAAAETIQIDLRSGLPTGNQISLNVDGGGGADSVSVYCSSGNDNAILQPIGMSTVNGPNYSLSLSHCPATSVYGDGGSDSAILYDPPGNSVAVLTPAYAYVQNTQSGIFQVAVGFSVVTAYSNQGGNDAAWLYDSPGNDLAVMTPSYAYFALNYTTPVIPYETALGFAHVTANANAGGYDTIWTYGSTGSDNLFFTPHYGYMSGSTFNNWFAGFDLTYAQGYGGQDSARLLDSPDADIYVGTGTTGRMTSLTATYELNISAFSNVNMSGAAGGLNVITLSNLGYAISYSGFVSSSNFVHQPMARSQALVLLKQVALAVDPALASVTDPTTLAIMLRNDAHNGVRIGVTSSRWESNDAYERFVQAVLTQQEPLICGGEQILYVDLLQAFGLQGRYVDLFANDINHNTHATVEVMLGGKWVVMDPTFNVSFVGPNGQHLSYADLQAGVPYTISRDGMVSRPLLIIENYPITLQQFLNRITYVATVTN
jgi:hypothetical protein